MAKTRMNIIGSSTPKHTTQCAFVVEIGTAIVVLCRRGTIVSIRAGLARGLKDFDLRAAMTMLDHVVVTALQRPVTWLKRSTR